MSSIVQLVYIFFHILNSFSFSFLNLNFIIICFFLKSLSLREENVGLKNRLDNQDKKLTQLRKIITGRDFRVRELEEREKELLEKVGDIK